MTVERTTPTLLRKEGRKYAVLPADSIALIKSADGLAIWAYLQSKPQDWIVRKADIMRRLDMGRVRYAEAMKHLRDVGLVAATANQGKNGKMAGRVLICLDSPKYTEPAISAAPKYTETERSVSANVAEPSPLVIKDLNPSNNGIIKTESDDEKPEKPTTWPAKEELERRQQQAAGE